MGKDMIEIPMHAAQFLVDHQNEFHLFSNSEWHYDNTLSKLAELNKKTTEELVQQKWWKAFRRYFIVVKA
jgi:hypothetical protein